LATSFRNANLSGVDLSGVRHSTIFLGEVDFSNANLSKAKLSPERDRYGKINPLIGAAEGRKGLGKCIFTNTNLSYADLSCTCYGNLRDAYLHGADLRRADLRGSYIKNANIIDADLTGALSNVAYEGWNLHLGWLERNI
jgi:uncharacterized protein YjbI with pentapeptide repeats